MNNKGFTTIEVIVSFALVVIIMASMTTMLVAYRDSINVEETKTKMLEFKNTFTYMVYQDIILDKITSIQPCTTEPKCYRNNRTCGYEWGKHYAGELYTLIPGIANEDECMSQVADYSCVENPNISNDTSVEVAGMCAQFIGENKKINTLRLERDVVVIGSEGEHQRRIYLNYNGIRMMLPDSDLNRYDIDTNDSGETSESERLTSQISDFVIQRDEANQVYSLTIPFSHNKIHYYDSIKIVVSN